MEAKRIQEIFSSAAIKEIEREIIDMEYEVERSHISTETAKDGIRRLLEIRRTLLNQMFVMDEENKQLLSDFNEALKAQMIEMRKRAVRLLESAVASDASASYELTGKCFLGYEYSKIHPVQTIRAKKMWAVMNGTLDKYMPLYEDGASCCFSLTYRDGKMDAIPTEYEILYLEDRIDNWNDELDREMTKDMHLIHAFHNLYSHMEFSIFDLLWVRDFNIEISVEADYDTYPADYARDDLDWDKYDYDD